MGQMSSSVRIRVRRRGRGRRRDASTDPVVMPIARAFTVPRCASVGLDVLQIEVSLPSLAIGRHHGTRPATAGLSRPMPARNTEGDAPRDEAVRPKCDSAPLRVALEVLQWTGIPRASAADVARALGFAGFKARLGGPGHIALLRDDIEVAWIPIHDEVHPATLNAILRTIGVSPEQLAAYLAESHRER
jgi:hypothetical protein